MRRFLLALAVLGGLAVPAGADDPGGPRTTALPATEQLAMASGRLVYVSVDGSREQLRALDLESGADTLLYAPRGGATIEDMIAGGDRVAVQVTRYGRERELHRVVAVPAAGGPRTTIASGRFRPRRSWSCGRAVALRDVTDAGEVVVEEADLSCRARPGTRADLRGYGSGGSRVLRTLRVGDPSAVLGKEETIRVAGDRVLLLGDRRARVHDVATGAARTLLPSARRFDLGPADVDAAGNVLLSEFEARGLRILRGRLRLVRPGDPPRDGLVLFDSRRSYGEALFCGGRVVVAWSSGRGAAGIEARDSAGAPPRAVHAAPAGTFGFPRALCDPGRVVLADGDGEGPARAHAYPLAPR
jgi:hypothetical protein